MEDLTEKPGGMRDRYDGIRKKVSGYAAKLKDWLDAGENPERSGNDDAFDDREETTARPADVKGRVTELRERFVSCGQSVCRGYRQRIDGLTPGKRLALLFVVAVVAGVAIKLVAVRSVTMGYNDFTGAQGETYDLVSLSREVAAEGASSAVTPDVGGGSCGQ